MTKNKFVLIKRCLPIGAVAGLADHPLQTLMQTDTEGQERSSAASGIVTGMGKGLVGVLTKPIGGAAEFVSQTGQGKCKMLNLLSEFIKRQVFVKAIFSRHYKG